MIMGRHTCSQSPLSREMPKCPGTRVYCHVTSYTHVGPERVKNGMWKKCPVNVTP